MGGKNVRISDIGRKISLNFSEDIQVFEVLCLKFLLSPHQNFLDPPLPESLVDCFQRGDYSLGLVHHPCVYVRTSEVQEKKKEIVR